MQPIEIEGIHQETVTNIYPREKIAYFLSGDHDYNYGRTDKLIFGPGMPFTKSRIAGWRGDRGTVEREPSCPTPAPLLVIVRLAFFGNSDDHAIEKMYKCPS
jgi:hypothetical protein